MTIVSKKEYELYSYGDSLASQTARLGLSEKSIDFKHNHIYLESKGEHLQPNYKIINPKCFVPALIHSGKTVCDSVRILEYIDTFSPDIGPKLFPNDENLNIEVRSLVKEFSLDEKIKLGENFGTSVALASTPILAKLLCKRSTLDVIWDYSTKHPDKQRALIFIILRLIGGPPNFVEKKALSGIARGISFIETFLSHGKDYIAGDYSSADCLLTGLLHRLEDLALQSILTSDKLPLLKNYWLRLKERPSYKTAILDWELEEWKEVKEKLYGCEDNPKINFFWSEFEKIKIN